MAKPIGERTMKKVEQALRTGVENSKASLIGRAYDTADPREVDEFVARVMGLIRGGVGDSDGG